MCRLFQFWGRLLRPMSGSQKSRRSEPGSQYLQFLCIDIQFSRPVGIRAVKHNLRALTAKCGSYGMASYK